MVVVEWLLVVEDMLEDEDALVVVAVEDMVPCDVSSMIKVVAHLSASIPTTTDKAKDTFQLPTALDMGADTVDMDMVTDKPIPTVDTLMAVVVEDTLVDVDVVLPVVVLVVVAADVFFGGRGSREAQQLAQDPGYAYRANRSTRSGGTYFVADGQDDTPQESFDSGNTSQDTEMAKAENHSEEMFYGEGENDDSGYAFDDMGYGYDQGYDEYGDY